MKNSDCNALRIAMKMAAAAAIVAVAGGGSAISGDPALRTVHFCCSCRHCNVKPDKAPNYFNKKS